MSKILSDAEVDASDKINGISKCENIDHIIESYDHNNTVEYDSQEDKHELLEKKNYLKIQ